MNDKFQFRLNDNYMQKDHTLYDLLDYKDKLSNGGYRVSRHSQPFYREIKDLISTYADDALYELKQDYPELQQSLDQYREDYLSDRYGGLTEFYQQ